MAAGFDYSEWARFSVRRSATKSARFVKKYAESDEDVMAARASALRSELRSQDRCADCGRPLEDPESVARGVGPDCWGKRARAAR